MPPRRSAPAISAPPRPPGRRFPFGGRRERRVLEAACRWPPRPRTTDRLAPRPVTALGRVGVEVGVGDEVLPVRRRLERHPSVRREEHLDPRVRVLRGDVSRSPEPAGSPGVKPTASLAGMPSVRSITAIALANCWQKPVLVSVRNSSIASSLVEPGTVSSYVNPHFGSVKWSWIAMILS